MTLILPRRRFIAWLVSLIAAPAMVKADGRVRNSFTSAFTPTFPITAARSAASRLERILKWLPRFPRAMIQNLAEICEKEFAHPKHA